MDASQSEPQSQAAPSTTEKPRVIQAARVVAIVQIVLSLAFIGVAVWLVSYDPTGGFWAGFREAMTEDMPFYSYEDAGALSAGPIVTIITSVLVLVGLSRRTRQWSITSLVAVGIQILIGVISLSIPFLALLNMLLLLSAPGKAYLNLAKPTSPASTGGSGQAE